MRARLDSTDPRFNEAAVLHGGGPPPQFPKEYNPLESTLRAPVAARSKGVDATHTSSINDKDIKDQSRASGGRDSRITSALAGTVTVTRSRSHDASLGLIKQ